MLNRLIIHYFLHHTRVALSNPGSYGNGAVIGGASAKISEALMYPILSS